MPVYEFYCGDCNTIFNFFSYRTDTTKRPVCPKCRNNQMERLISRVSVLRGAKEESDMKIPDIDESKLQKAMSLLEKEASNLKEDDPRQAAHVIRRLIDTTGLNLGSKMEEALRRLEKGEDPDMIEKDMEDILDEDNLFGSDRKNPQKNRKAAPLQDETLYYL